MNRLFKMAMACALVAGLALTTTSCGGVPAEPLTTTSIGVVMGQFKTALDGLPTSNNTPTMPVSGFTTSSNVETMAIDCETVSPTLLVDADGDGIAATKTGTFDCVDTVSGSNSYTRKGTITVKDKDDTVDGVLGGLRVEFAISKFNSKDLTNNNEYEYSYNGYLDYKGDGNGAISSTSDFTGSTKYKSSNYNNDYTYNYVWDWSVTPTDGSNTWTGGGKINFSGSFSLSGSFVYEVNGVHSQKSGSFVVKYNSKDLVYGVGACTKFYESGSIFVSDSMGTNMEIRYSCNTAKFFVNGVESTLFTP